MHFLSNFSYLIMNCIRNDFWLFYSNRHGCFRKFLTPSEYFYWLIKTLVGRQSNKKKCSNFVSKRTKVNIKKCFCSKQNSSFLSKNVNYNSILRSVLDIYRNIKEKLEKLILKMNLNSLFIFLNYSTVHGTLLLWARKLNCNCNFATILSWI